MEYFLGSVITLLVFLISNIIINKYKDNDIKNFPRYRQSHINELMSPYMPTNKQLKKILGKESQSAKHQKNLYIKILFVDGKAYWIKDNSFYVADTVDGNIVEESTKKVDIMGMDKIELDKMSFIVEKLTEGL